MLATKLIKKNFFDASATFFSDDDDDIDIVFETLVYNLVASLML